MWFTAFIDEMEKLGAESHAKAVERHHRSDAKDWKAFEKGLQSIGFQRAVIAHPDSDSKLKKYVKNVGGYFKSKNVVATVPSRTSSKLYKIKELPSGRLACGCGNWQYVHSVRDSDCDHIVGLKTKSSSAAEAFLHGVHGARTLHRASDQWKRGKESKEISDRAGPPKPKKSLLDKADDVYSVIRAGLGG